MNEELLSEEDIENEQGMIGLDGEYAVELAIMLQTPVMEAPDVRRKELKEFIYVPR